MTDNESTPALPETRSSRVIKVALALSECEQEELRMTLAAQRLRKMTTRLGDWRSCLTVGLHSGLLFGISYALIMAVFAAVGAITSGSPLSALFVAAGTLFFTALACGGTAGLCLAAIYKIAYPHILKNLEEKRTGTFQMDEIEVHLPITETFSMCRTAIEATKGTRLEKSDETNGELRATVRMTLLSPGESMGVKLEAVDVDRTHVKIYSKDLYNSWGLGKNRKNVKELKAAIEEQTNVHKLLLEHKETT